MLNIQDREDIFNKLGRLSKDDIPVFGRMSAQHMVEHLSFTVMMSNGKLPHALYYSKEKADKIREYTIQTDKEIIIGFRAPMLPSDPVPLKNNSLEAARKQLKHELTAFDEYFMNDPDGRPTNPTMGPLRFDEWLIFHNKHFTHHFKQFNLL